MHLRLAGRGAGPSAARHAGRAVDGQPRPRKHRARCSRPGRTSRRVPAGYRQPSPGVAPLAGDPVRLLQPPSTTTPPRPPVPRIAPNTTRSPAPAPSTASLRAKQPRISHFVPGYPPRTGVRPARLTLEEAGAGIDPAGKSNPDRGGGSDFRLRFPHQPGDRSDRLGVGVWRRGALASAKLRRRRARQSRSSWRRYEFRCDRCSCFPQIPSGRTPRPPARDGTGGHGQGALDLEEQGLCDTPPLGPGVLTATGGIGGRGRRQTGRIGFAQNSKRLIPQLSRHPPTRRRDDPPPRRDGRRGYPGFGSTSRWDRTWASDTRRAALRVRPPAPSGFRPARSAVSAARVALFGPLPTMRTRSPAEDRIRRSAPASRSSPL